ncbi:MAG: UDP-N-acetylmuramoyl-L-alanyl-D-glutamate--2,6-diaminopimelate ligase [Thermodesulfobacteriota bacterium]
MKLSSLLETDTSFRKDDAAAIVSVPLEAIPGSEAADPEIRSIHCRAQEVQPSGLFVAVPGLAVDGHTYIDEAVGRGAAAIVVQRPVQKNIVTVQVQNTRKALAQLAARFYRDPSQQLCLIGITGTNGKTTTAFLIESILAAAGHSVGVIGTIDYRFAGRHYENPVTTPESLDLQRILAEMRQQGVGHVVLEVSSHAIDLHRIHDCQFDIGIFTNLTQDHLDYHGDMQRYWSCKKKFFSEHLSSGPKKEKAVAVVCADHREGRELLSSLNIRTLSVGYSNRCAVSAGHSAVDLSGISAEVSFPGGSFKLKSALIGAHNMENILCAVGAGLSLNIPPETIRIGIENLSAVPGRLERIADTAERFVYVDYAHTPDALKNVLSALRLISENRIICVFGCGGDRDRGKRPLMGEIAGRICDLAIITSDNPRTEDPLRIIGQIRDGIHLTSAAEFSTADIKTGFAKKGFVVEPDRREAIRLGVSVSRPGDIILIAGKGHETYQIVGKQKRPFDDRSEARQAFSLLGKGPATQAQSGPLGVEGKLKPPCWH